MTSSVLMQAGYSVGMYTSPHLVDVRERIQVNGSKISEEEFRDTFVDGKSKLVGLTFFELLTLMAVLHFVKKKVDYAIFEVGLGGTYDATNFDTTFMSAITKISLDHLDVLGKSVEEIARDKCGIIKQGQTVVTTSANTEVMEIIKQTAAAKKAKLVVAAPTEYPLALKGQFQKQNAGIVVEVTRALGVPDDVIKKGLLAAKWPGRVEYLEKNILMDSAHNPGGITALSEYVKTLKYSKLIIVFAVSKNKDYERMLTLLPKYDALIFTQSTVVRRLPIEEIPPELECVKIREPLEALRHAKSMAGAKDLILVCGSIFLIGDVKRGMVEKNIEVDEKDNVLGLRPRDDFYTGKHIHRASHLVLLNSKDEILVQKRVPTKKWYPNLYTFSVSGTVADESYEHCMKKEMQEEIGISIPVKFIFKFPFFDKLDKAFHAIFVGKSDEEIKPDKREMTEARWIPAEDLKKDIKEHPEKYTPPFVEGMKKYFAEF